MYKGWRSVSALAAVTLAFTFGLAGPQAQADRPANLAAWVRPDTAPYPADNPFTQAKLDLGKRLFTDKRLSGGNSMSCSSCHDPAKGFSDARPRAVGEGGEAGPMHTPTLWNLAWTEQLFWDGRAGSLEKQALGPIANPIEMNQDLATLTAELAGDRDLEAAFARAFPQDPVISLDNIAKAIAIFERTLVSPATPFDRWIAGDEGAISASAKRGFTLFDGRAACSNCHKGWAFTDGAFHDIGLPGTGPGRGGVVGHPELFNSWKTPTLRELGRSAPYMHDGSIADLKGVLRHYVSGAVHRPTLSRDLPHQLDLAEAEQADVLAFLATLDADPTALPATVAAVSAVDPAPLAANGPAPSRIEVSQQNTAFSVPGVRLRKGGTLVIHNEDTRVHNIRVFSADMDYDSGVQDPGQSVEVLFDKNGRFRAVCNIHPKMKMSVEVVEQ
ncbi:cytochrome c peroxidase [Niveispirillum sp. KHB5.9]|uniref:cytochrome c peroxidase n=1 Tax=Niveispirillum sp. KHB5.9 TaxID=3400269 RepID=UPI003A8696E4